jgi:hypothetical protein
VELRERGKVLAELAGQSGLAELYSLVDELHLRRREEGLQAADLGYQEQLKALIHLVHRLGRLEGAQRAVDQQLLARLKKASQHLRRARPKGLLRAALEVLDVSWPGLVAAFAVLLAQEGLAKFLGARLPKLQDYLTLQRLLYLFFASRLVQGRRGHRQPRYMLDERELRKVLPEELDWAGLEVPLLPLPERRLLLSPELLQDHLLQKYLETALFYHSCRGEERELKFWDLPGWQHLPAAAPNIWVKGGGTRPAETRCREACLREAKPAQWQDSGGVLVPEKKSDRPHGGEHTPEKEKDGRGA